MMRGIDRSRGRSGASSLVLSPVVARELRVALHRWDIRKSRSNVARLGVLGVSIFMLFGALTGTGSWGRTLHFYLFLGGLGLAVGPAFRISVGLFAEERRQQTLELLYLTGMGSGELFAGKLLGGVVVASSELLALAPLIAVPFLGGGLSFQSFLATVVCLPTVFMVVLATGCLGSACSRHEGTALVVAGGLLGFVCLALPLPYNLGYWLAGAAPFVKSWLLLSPASGPWIVAGHFAGFRVSDFWVWTGLMWGMSAICLALAAAVMKWNWRRDLERTAAAGWQANWKGFAIGSTQWRKRLRQRVLEINAYQWLTQQDRRPVLMAWGFIGVVCILWLLAWCAWPRLWPSPVNFYATAALLLGGVYWLVLRAAGRQMAADRRDGTIEMVLTTPLNPQEMLDGQKAALHEQFKPVKLVLCGLLVLMAIAGLLMRQWTAEQMVSYLAIWCVLLFWCWRPAQQAAPLAMWVAANCGRPMYMGRQKGGPWNAVWKIYWLSMVANGFGIRRGWAQSFPNGSTLQMVFILFAVFWVIIFVAFAKRPATEKLAEALVSQLRAIAQEPLPERNDPRFKQWKDVRTRFPGATDGIFGDLSESSSPSRPIKAAGAWLWRPVGRVFGLAWGNVLKAVTKRNP
jgi:hypothetical protein